MSKSLLQILSKRERKKHNQKRKIPNRTSTLPLPALQHPFYGDQRHASIQKTPLRTGNTKHLQASGREKRRKKHRTTHRTQRHYRRIARGHG